VVPFDGLWTVKYSTLIIVLDMFADVSLCKFYSQLIFVWFLNAVYVVRCIKLCEVVFRIYHCSNLG